MDIISRFLQPSVDAKLVVYLKATQLTALLFREDRCLGQLVLTETTPEAVRQPLKQWLAEFDCKRPEIHILLSEGCYQSSQIDKPKVPESEITAALPWAVKDLISIAPENMQLDYYDLPSPGLTPRINVIVAEKQWLANWVSFFTIEIKGLVKDIQIEELALLSLFQEYEAPVLLLWQKANQDGRILLIHQQGLYLSRSLRGSADLSSMHGELLAALIDNLSLEVQRALDFFESNLRQPPVKQILLFVDSANQSMMRDLMAANLAADVQLFSAPLLEQSELPATHENLPALGALFTQLEEVDA